MNRFETCGVCSKGILYEIENGVLKTVEFESGCQGNLLGIKALIEGMGIEDIVRLFWGIKCGQRLTSCPDQLARALKEFLTEEER